MKRSGFWLPFVLLLAAITLVSLAGMLSYSDARLPSCRFKEFLGLPCPTCGGTRAFAALSQGDLAGALRLNPLATSAWIGLVMWSVLRLLRVRACEHALDWAEKTLHKPGALVTAGVLLGMQWVFLWLCLPP